MVEIDYINGAKITEIFGRSKYQQEIHNRLESVKLNVIDYTPITSPLIKRGRAIAFQRSEGHSPSTSLQVTSPISHTMARLAHKSLAALLSIIGVIDTIDRFLRYTYLVRKRVKKGTIKHLTSQELAYILCFIKLKKTVVTCYDLIPYIYSHDRSLSWRLNIRGMKKADRIITISEFSKKDIIDYVGYPGNKIHIVYPAVDHDRFYLQRDRTILKKYTIPENQKIVLYVGSEHPRQNVPLLLKAFDKLRVMSECVTLIKVGNPQWPGARNELLKLIEALNIQENVIFAGYVAEEELPRWYNCADLFVYPCLYTGFSLPCLEAMSCGTPVITSNVSVLPEVIGDAGLTVDPYTAEQWAMAMYKVLNDTGLREDLISKGLKRAKMFSWDRAAAQTLEVYEEVYNGD